MRVILVLCLVILCLSGSLWAYSPARPYPLRPKGQRLVTWFKRDLQPYDQRQQIIGFLRRLRALIAKSEALGLSAVEKSSLISLTKALEKEMAKTLAEIREKTNLLEKELAQKRPQEEECLKLASEINSLWGEIHQKALKTYLKALKLIEKD